VVDLRLRLNEDGADLVLEDGDLALDGGLESAALAALFTDGRVDPPAPPVDGERRGYWADTAADRYGSLLWTQDRQTIRTPVLVKIQEHAGRALGWMLEDGIAERIEVVAGRFGREVVTLEVTILRGSANRWAGIWASIADATTVEVDGMRVKLLPLA